MSGSVDPVKLINDLQAQVVALQEENRRLRNEIAEYKALLMEDEDAE